MENVKLINADAENLPIKDDSLDFIWSWGVIHHSLNTEKNYFRDLQNTKKKWEIQNYDL